MSELLWYVYQNGQQMGPLSEQQLTDMVNNTMIAHDSYLFKVGWKDWRPIEDTYEELGIVNPPLAKSPKRRTAAPRATINGRVVVHNNGRLAIGIGVNISSTGIFVESPDRIFSVGEKLKLSVKVKGISKPFNAVAQVIRFNSDARYPVGYGLKFESLEENIRTEIQRLVDEQNAVVRDEKEADHVSAGGVRK